MLHLMVLRVRGILMDKSGRIILVKNKGMAYYSLPGGHAEKNEPTKETIIREIQEELGLQLKETHMKFVVEMPHINSFECYYVSKVEGIDIATLRGVDFAEELDEVVMEHYQKMENYFPKWLKKYSLEQIFSKEVIYIGIVD